MNPRASFALAMCLVLCFGGVSTAQQTPAEPTDPEETTAESPAASSNTGDDAEETAVVEESAQPEGAEVPLEAAEAASRGKPEETAFDRFLYFLGRFHPIVLHFPIGLLVALVLLEGLNLIRKPKRDTDAARWLLLVLGAASAVVASTFGVFLSWSSSYDVDLVWWHKWTGIGVAVAAVLAVGFRFQYERSLLDKFQWGYAVALLAGVGVLVPAGHYGAALTHGPTYLTKYLPEQLSFLAPILGEVKDGSGEPLAENYFTSEILPILEAKCFECHNATKQDGRLRLDRREDCLLGGESELAAIVPGDAMGSYMVELMLLPAEHKDVMPPEGKPVLEPGETLALATWINRGAPFGEFVPAAPEESDTSPLDMAALLEGGTAPAELRVEVPLIESPEIMQLFFEEQFATLQKALVEEPKGRSAMKAVYNSAFALGEAHNLLFSRVEEEYMDTPEWETLTVVGRRAAQDIGAALQERDYPAMKSAFEILVNSCNTCHTQFELDVDPITIEPPPEEPEEEKPRRRRRR